MGRLAILVSGNDNLGVRMEVLGGIESECLSPPHELACGSPVVKQEFSRPNLFSSHITGGC